jgi:hypothetical protein
MLTTLVTYQKHYKSQVIICGQGTLLLLSYSGDGTVHPQLQCATIIQFQMQHDTLI